MRGLSIIANYFACSILCSVCAVFCPLNYIPVFTHEHFLWIQIFSQINYIYIEVSFNTISDMITLTDYVYGL